jgi:L-rhamnose isomerase/sugar isomerase
MADLLLLCYGWRPSEWAAARQRTPASSSDRRAAIAQGTLNATTDPLTQQPSWQLPTKSTTKYPTVYRLTDVSPILAMARHRAGGAIDPIATYRASGYRAAVAAVRLQGTSRGAGIVG